MKFISLLVFSLLIISCSQGPKESWHPHKHKKPSSYKRK